MARPKGVLTLAILEKAIRELKKSQEKNEIVGFKVNPADLESIKMGTGCIWAIDDNRFFVTPPYNGVILKPDCNVPPGYPVAIRREDS